MSDTIEAQDTKGEEDNTPDQNNEAVFVVGVILLVAVILCFLALFIIFIKKVRKCGNDDGWEVSSEPVVVIKKTGEFPDDVIAQEDSGIAGSEGGADRDSISASKEESSTQEPEDDDESAEIVITSFRGEPETKVTNSSKKKEALKTIEKKSDGEADSEPKEENNNSSTTKESSSASDETENSGSKNEEDKEKNSFKVVTEEESEVKAAFAEDGDLPAESVNKDDEEDRIEREDGEKIETEETLSSIPEESGAVDVKNEKTSLPNGGDSNQSTPSKEGSTADSPDILKIQSNTSIFDGSLLESSTSLYRGIELLTDKNDTCILLGPGDVVYCDPKTEPWDDQY